MISGSTADRSDFIEKGDRVFFVQGHSTRQVTRLSLLLVSPDVAPEALSVLSWIFLWKEID